MLIRILIVAGIRLYRDGLALLLDRQDQMQVIGAYSRIVDLMAHLREPLPDVILLDMASTDSHAIGRALRISVPDIPVVTIGIEDSDTEVMACAEMGAAGYVTREGSLEDLVAAMRSAAKGELICSPRIAGTLARRVAALARDRSVEPLVPRLTRREQEIAALLQQDFSNKEIATQLRIEVATVKNHVHNLLEKLHLHKRTDACRALAPHGRSSRIPLTMPLRSRVATGS